MAVPLPPEEMATCATSHFDSTSSDFRTEEKLPALGLEGTVKPATKPGILKSVSLKFAS